MASGRWWSRSKIRNSRRHSSRRSRGTLALEHLEARKLLAADMVLRWNEVIDEAIRNDTTQIGPTYAARNYAIVHAAIYDAVVSITKTHEPFLVEATAPYYASLDAAVASAAYHSLIGLYPLQSALFQGLYDQCLAEIPDGISEDAGVAIGLHTATLCLANRANDHAGDIVPYTPGNEPGDWRPAPPIEDTPAWGPGWGAVTTFVLESGSQFRPPAPPDLSSPEYAAAYNEVKELGALNSATRTAEQTEIGIFWGYDRQGLGPPPIFYNEITRSLSLKEGLSLEENARLFALTNLAQADAGIVSWDAKFAFDFWRPITAIREGENDGNPLTEGDPDWEPLGAPGGGVVDNFTPPFPAYTSGHATFGAAFFGMLANYFGTDEYEFSASSDELPGVVRHFTSFSQAAAENARSRIYLGIHWNFDDFWGRSTGFEVADYVFQHALRERQTEPVDVVVGAGATQPPLVRVYHPHTGELLHEFLAYHPDFRGGVRVALGDINHDGVDDIVTAAGPGGGPHVRVFDGTTGAVIRDFFAYHPDFRGGVFVATGDLDGDGHDDIITGADAGGGPHLRAFSGANGVELLGLFAYHPDFRGGVRVAAVDVDGDGFDEIITGAGAGGGPHVRAFRLDGTLAADLFAYHPDFRGGVNVAGGDLDGDGAEEIITGAGAGGGPHVRAFNIVTGTVDASFMAYNPVFTGGVQVAASDADGDDRADIIVAPGFGGSTEVRLFRGFSMDELPGFRAFPEFESSVFVAGGQGGHPLGPPLLAAGGASASAPAGEMLTAAALQPLFAAAVDRWRDAGLSADLLAQLRDTEVRIDDLVGAVLGRLQGDVIVIDRDAAGYGWFIDPTPDTNEEFPVIPDGRLSAPADNPARGMIDLLTVLSHELGHVLGLPDAHKDDELMSADLPTGVRRTPSQAAVDLLFATGEV